MKNPEPVQFDHMAVSIVGSIQPDRLATLLMNGDDDGMAARFLFTWPESVKPSRPYHQPDDHLVVRAFGRLQKLAFEANTDSGQPQPITLPVARAVLDVFQQWREQHYRACQSATGLMASALGKMPGQALRLGLVLELLWWAAGPEATAEPDQVSAAALGAALDLVESYFKPMLTRVLGEAALPQVDRQAAVLARAIQSRRAAADQCAAGAPRLATAGPAGRTGGGRRDRCPGGSRLADPAWRSRWWLGWPPAIGLFGRSARARGAVLMSWSQRMVEAQRRATSAANSAERANRLVDEPNGAIGTIGTRLSISGQYPVGKLSAQLALSAPEAATVPPCPAGVAERAAAIIAERDRSDGGEADERGLGGLSDASVSAHADAQRDEISSALDRLPVPCTREGVRLLKTTRHFIASRWFDEAIRCGWGLSELFGLDSFVPLDEAAWGLVVGLALAPRKSDEIISIDEEAAVIRYRASHGWRRRSERQFTPAIDALVWWECTGLVVSEDD